MIILDASVLYPLAKLVARDGERLSSRLVDEDAHILDLTIYELGNALVVEERRGVVRDSKAVLKGIRTLLEVLGVLRTSPGDLEDIYGTAQSLALTFYDAAYVHHARKNRAKLLTQDRELLEKSRDVAISLDEWVEGDKY